jgi:putative ABC transport system substrate-binding protein
MSTRREFITVLGGAAAACPIVARAQQPAMPVIGVLSSQTRETESARIGAVRQGLNETGFVEGRSAAIEYRFADGHGDRGRTRPGPFPMKSASAPRSSADGGSYF